MIKNLNDTAMQEYTPWFYAISVPLFYYILISFFQLSSWAPPRWMWYLGIVYLLAGVILQFLSKRLMLTQGFQVLGVAGFALLAWLLACLLLTEGLGPSARVIVGLAVSFFAVGNIVHEYRMAARETGFLGYGRSGQLDAETGLLHPHETPNQLEIVNEPPRQSQRNALQIAALAAGLSSLLVNVLSDQGVYWFIAFLVLGFLWLGTFLVGRMSCRIFWVHAWEQEHRMTIFVVY